MIDLLVFSHAAFRRVNRLVYHELRNNSGLDIRLVAPSSLVQGGVKRTADVPKEGDVPVVFKQLIGSNPRTYAFEETENVLQEYKPKVIYLDNDPMSEQAIFLGKWASENDSKLICLTCENLSLGFWDNFRRRGTKGLLATIFKRYMLVKSRKNVSHVFTINNAGLEIFKELGFRSVSKTPLGFDPNVFFVDAKERQLKREELGIEDDCIVVSYIGRTVKEKGVHVLVKALKSIKTSNWVLLLDEFSTTKTDYQEEILKLIEQEGISDKVKYFDAPHHEVAKYMNASDVVVIPSITSPNWVEQYGRVAPEAMACGKLVVASNVGALPELLEDCGVLIEENNVAALAEKLSYVISNYDSFELIRSKAVERANSKLSIKTQSDLLQAKVNELML